MAAKKTSSGDSAKPAEAAPKNDTAVTAPSRDRPGLVVGVGASAGGLDAFKAFFSQMPADSGMAFVLVQHLAPKYESSLAAIIAHYTAMPVRVAEDGTSIAFNEVYVIPPDAILTITSGVLRLVRPAPPADRRTSIDTFLASLAEDQGENAVGVILSGFGSDGALGIAAIKEHGGLTLSQAEFDHRAKRGMPESAASGGFVDHVLAVEDMAPALLNYQRHRSIFDAAKGPDGLRDDLRSNLPAICAILHGRLGRDFSRYKPGTLMRRIQRRMHVLQITEARDYIEQLRTQPEQAEHLFRELLIGVTRFFRDREAFGALEVEIVARLLRSHDANAPIRIWVPGCATGEEAYSIAILFREGMERLGCRRGVQIFATDLDDRAIDAARTGLYSNTVACDNSAERLERYFVKENDNYRVAKDIRELCLFSIHDLVKDPPISKLDLISCRNLLIYLEPQLQHQILTSFHYALRPGAHLFLGSSESVSAQSRLFGPLNRRYRLYTRRAVAPSIPSIPSFLARGTSANKAPTARVTALAGDDLDIVAARTIARYAPAFLIVDRHHEILRFSGQTAKYLEPSAGVASLSLFHLLHRDLRGAARAALNQAATSREPVLRHSASMATSEGDVTINLIVEPLHDTEEGDHFLIAFQDTGQPISVRMEAAGAKGDQDRNVPMEVLNKELLGTRERLRKLTEELEAANEELQSSNEEYLSINEELQSANEELETSKEELQSLNEELQTINAELNHRNDALVRSNSDLANLFDSTAIATLFLDKGLRIRRFTPGLPEIFNVRDGDEGRPITDIVTRLTRGGLKDDVEQVLRTLAPLEREVALVEGATCYLMQVRPYRDLNNVIDGAVVSFVDISERKRHEEGRARLAAIVESSSDAIISHNLMGVVTSWNSGAEQLLGFPASDAIGRSASVLLAGIVPDWPSMLARLGKGERISHDDSVFISKGGRSIAVAVTVSAIKDGDGAIIGASVVARDISDRKAAEKNAALLLGELDHRVKNILTIVNAVVSHTLRTTPSPEEFAVELEGRIGAIAQAHGLLTRAGRGEVTLHSIIAMELAPYDHGNGNIVISGPDIALTPKAGLALAMAVHELASNAAKYGSLSTMKGALKIKWNVAAGSDEILTLSWTETGGPPVQAPTRRGFGTAMIEQALSYELDAEVRREFQEIGLRCIISIPFTAAVGRLQACADTQGQT